MMFNSDGIPYDHPSVVEIEQSIAENRRDNSRSVAKALVEADWITRFTLEFVDNYNAKLQSKAPQDVTSLGVAEQGDTRENIMGGINE